MAIAGITIQTTAEAYGTVRERLCASKDVADTQETGVPGMLAAVMETDAAYIEDALGALSGWDGVLNVGLVSISYEDELENKGYISCPEHKPRKCGPACPSGALRPVAAMKEANMGRAVIFKDRCLNWIESGTMCMTCYDRCPLRGEGMVLDMGYVPAVGESCVGCGMCEYVCPKNAVAVVPDVQKKGGKA